MDRDTVKTFDPLTFDPLDRWDTFQLFDTNNDTINWVRNPNNGVFSTLTDLTINISSEPIWTTHLARLTNLKALALWDCRLTGSLNCLSSLVDLNSLEICNNNNITNVSFLGKFKFLTNLKLSNCKRVYDITVFQHLTSLTMLTMENCPCVDDIDPFEYLTNLTGLMLVDMDDVWDLDFVDDMTNLESLYVQGCNRISDISHLKYLVNLKMFDISFCRGINNEDIDLNFLKSTTSLTSLSLPRDLKFKDLSAFVNLTNLTDLNLSESGLNDIRHIVTLTSLVSLDLSSCKNLDLSNTTPLRSLTRLERLTLGNCGFTDISFLKYLTSLTKLLLIARYDHEEISVLNDLPNLTDLRIVSGNRGWRYGIVREIEEEENHNEPEQFMDEEETNEEINEQTYIDMDWGEE